MYNRMYEKKSWNAKCVSPQAPTHKLLAVWVNPVKDTDIGNDKYKVKKNFYATAFPDVWVSGSPKQGVQSILTKPRGHPVTHLQQMAQKMHTLSVPVLYDHQN